MGLERTFLIMTPNSEAINKMVDRWDDGKRPHMQSEKINWKKIFVTYITEKGLIFPIYKKPLQINKKNRWLLEKYECNLSGGISLKKKHK